MELSEASEEALLKELGQRRKENIPKPLVSICTKQLEEIINEYFEYLICDENRDEDQKWENAIYEAALETVYGSDIWEWVNMYFE